MELDANRFPLPKTIDPGLEQTIIGLPINIFLTKSALIKIK
jgi:hypothetical protein